MHGTVSILRNRFFSMIRSRTLGFRHRQYNRLFLATAGFLVKNGLH